MSKPQQIVELQDLIDDLIRVKLDLQRQVGANTFKEVVSSYSSERGRTLFSDEAPDVAGRSPQRGTREQLRKIRSNIDKLFASQQ